MPFKNKRVEKIEYDLIIDIERKWYIYNSYRAFISVLAREFSVTKSAETCDMIEKYRSDFQAAFIEFKVTVNTLIHSLLGYIPDNVHYDFLFDDREVVLEWD